MSKKFTFCEECRRDVEYTEIEKELVSKLKGEPYYYTGKEATCVECGSRVYVADINEIGRASCRERVLRIVEC